MTQDKVTNDDGVDHTKRSKVLRVACLLGHSCGSLRSPLIIFFGVIEFISSIFFFIISMVSLLEF